MLLLDSLFINTSGGKILLDYLVKELEYNNIPVFYIFDDRVIKDYQEIPDSRKVYLSPSPLKRFLFYKKNSNKFSAVFCFGNFPPFLKRSNCKVFTYMHQPLYLKNTRELINEKYRLKTFFSLSIKKTILKMIRSNTHVWMVQLPEIKNKMHRKYGIPFENIKLLPFYPPLTCKDPTIERPKYSFMYVSSGAKHKNQYRLIHAFCKVYDQYNLGHLTLTIPDQFNDINNLIKNKQESGYPIRNIGYVDRSELCIEYKSHEYLIFPSLAESFGLGLVEAIDNGCKVIGADLPYLHDVCIPSLTFDPFSEMDIFHAFEKTMHKDLPESKSKISNQISELIEIITP